MRMKDRTIIWSRRTKTPVIKRNSMMTSKRWSQSWSNSSISKNWTMNAKISLWRSLVWTTALKEARRRANIRWLCRIKITRKTWTNRFRKTENIGTTRKCSTLDKSSKSSRKTKWKKMQIKSASYSTKKGRSMKNKRETWKSFKKTASLIWTTKYWRRSWPTSTNSRSSKSRTSRRIWRAWCVITIRRISTRRSPSPKKRSLWTGDSSTVCSGHTSRQESDSTFLHSILLRSRA